jgi:small subunit ribosomal protein S4
MKLFLKGERCLTEKCSVERRSYPPGEHGRGRIKQSEYLLQLREKQKARRYYGLLEKQFRTYYTEGRQGLGITGEELLRMLETRLDNVVYRLGFAASRAAGPPARAPRPLPGQRPPREHPELPGASDDDHLAQVGQPGRAGRPRRHRPDRLRDAVAPGRPRRPHGKVLKWPEREEIVTPVQESLIVELYSK